VTKSELLQFMRRHRLAVQASVSRECAPQSAVVGIAVTDALELVFDTMDSTRKSANLRRNSRIAFVIGGLTEGDERTAQYEGIADEPSGAELERVKAAYFDVWPDGRSRTTWPGLVYVRVRPTWIRYSDFTGDSPRIVEFDGASLREG
jgi:general stress protein 26